MAHRAVLVSKKGKEVSRELIRFDDFSQLPYQDPSSDVTVKVTYSNINFKDGIVLTGGGGVACSLWIKNLWTRVMSVLVLTVSTRAFLRRAHAERRALRMPALSVRAGKEIPARKRH